MQNIEGLCELAYYSDVSRGFCELIKSNIQIFVKVKVI